jgi:hypothetical protein
MLSVLEAEGDLECDVRQRHRTLLTCHASPHPPAMPNSLTNVWLLTWAK